VFGRDRRHGRNAAPIASALSTRWRRCPAPESVPVNALVPVKGTVLGDMLADTPLAKIDDIEFVRTVAVARITMPLSAWYACPQAGNR
jgi:biotin synthase-like enzyme